MAVRYAGMTATNPQAGRAQVIGAASGGTLAGGQVVQIVFDDTVFAIGNSNEAKQRLLAAIESITEAISLARSFPIDTSI